MARKNEAKLILTADDRTKAAFNSVRGNMDKFKSAAKSAAGAIGVLVGVGGFGAMVKSAINTGDEVSNLSTRLGISTEALSELRYAAEQTGVGVNSLGTGMQRMVRRVAEAANGSGEAVKALDELGLSAQSLKKLAPDQQFEVLAEALNGVGNQSDRVRLAMKLFDSEGVALLQTMDGGAEAVRNLREEARELGVTLDSHGAAKLAAADAAMKRMKASSMGLAQAAAIALGPAIADVSNWLATALPQAVDVARTSFHYLRQSMLNVAEGATSFQEGFYGVLSDVAGDVGLSDLSDSLFDTAQKFAGVKVNISDLNAAYDESFWSNKEFKAATGEFNVELTDFSANLEKSTQKTKGLTEAQKELKALMADGKRVFEETRTPAEDLNREYTRLNELLEVGAIDWDTYSRAVFQAQEGFEQAAASTEALKKTTEETNDVARDLGMAFSSAAEDAIVEWSSFQDFLNGLEQDLIRIGTRKLITEPLAGAATDFFSGGSGGGGLASWIGGLFSGGRAMGGAVSPGGIYEVNERGTPEMFSSGGHDYLMTGRSGGTVTQSPSGGNVTVNINVSGVQDEGGLRQSSGQVASAAARAVQRGQRNL